MVRWDCLDGPNWRFCYDDALFSPGTDSFQLADFARLKAGWHVCDLGAGTGLLGLLLLRREPALSVVGVELQSKAVQLAEENIAINRLAEHMQILHGDLRRIRTLLPAGQFQLVLSNPPYYPIGKGAVSPQLGRRVSRSEDSCTLSDVCQAAAYLLQWSGRFCVVCKPERLADLFCCLRESGMEGKRLRLIFPRFDSPPSLALVEGRRGGRSGLSIERPVVLQ